MSERVERRLVELLSGPLVSPYGNQIPGLDELGMPPETGTEVPILVLSAADAVASGVTRVTLWRIGENPQSLEGFLQAAVEIGLVPGTIVELSSTAEGVELATLAGAVEVPSDAARHLFVMAVSSVG